LSGWQGKAYRLTEWTMRLGYINLLWFLFILCGLLVFGLMPATAAMFYIMTKWLKGEENFHVFKTFFRYYKQNFLKANMAGVLLLIIGYILYFDLKIVQNITGALHHIILIGLLSFAIIYIVTLLFFFVVYTQKELDVYKTIRLSLLIGISNPVRSLLIFTSITATIYTIYLIPAMFPFFSGSLTCWLVIFFSINTLSIRNEKVNNPHRNLS
jgi:uncharacterized membrane protein YesL